MWKEFISWVPALRGREGYREAEKERKRREEANVLVAEGKQYQRETWIYRQGIKGTRNDYWVDKDFFLLFKSL